jgi:hypothetical protein
MTLFQKSNVQTLSAALLLSLCAACAAPKTSTQSHDHAHAADKSGVFKTVKPGAALQFSHQIDGVLSVGAYTDVVIQVADSYNSGSLSLSASGSEALDVLSSSAEMSRELAPGQAPTTLRVAVRPTHDGVHYLNVMGQVADAEAGSSMSRAYAVRLDLGGKTVDTVAGKPNIKMQGDKPVAAFQAVETIE